MDKTCDNIKSFSFIYIEEDKVLMIFILFQVNVPLPDCAPGEWGPTKAVKLMGLLPTSHLYPV